ncbi:hypothetical protein Vadar_007967 [Vaccinium darrowii]|uniref:Uncharacterized protein n=1 Tax=Vaccinium darrowii TaxID=229202 RepID=A0ACB7ZK81_9ERIC|nr:hypothetical protein Vadar_007967 [Vaccinium darrowii]
MIEAVMRLAEQNAQLLELQARRPHTSLAKQFIDLGAKEFTGTIDSAEEENWLKDAVRILNRMGVANDDKVDLVASMFKGEALHWWEATERLLTMPMPGVVPAVPQRITWARFQRGLNFKIRKELTGQGVITNYAELVHRAKMIEKDVMEEEEMKERYKKQKFSGQSGGSFGSGVTRSGGQRPQNSRGQSFHSQNRGARSGGNQFNRSTSGGNTNGNRGENQRCFQCGVADHLIRDCPQLDRRVICYKCGQPGHIATHCGQQAKTVVSSVGSAKNTGVGLSGSAQGGSRGSVGRPAVNGRVFAMSRQDAQATPEVVAVRADLFSGLKSLRVSLAVGACGSLPATLTLRPTLIDRIREAQNLDSNMTRIKAETVEDRDFSEVGLSVRYLDELVSVQLQCQSAMGLTLEFKDLFNLFVQRPVSILFGCVAQYTIMPGFGFIIGKYLGLPPSASVGLILLSCCPGGTASNVVTLIAQGDVPLSIVMTVCTTLGAVLLTPMLTKILAGTYVPVDAVKLSISTLQVVVAPILLGSYAQSTFPAAVKAVTPFAPLVAVLTSSLLACSVFSENVVRLKSSMLAASLSSEASPLLRAQEILSSELGVIILAVLLLHFAGFFVGYISAAIAGFKEPQRRAISIEVGMQNSSLGVVLATSHFASSMVALPPAMSAVIMNIMGSSLGFFWRYVDPSDSQTTSNVDK